MDINNNLEKVTCNSGTEFFNNTPHLVSSFALISSQQLVKRQLRSNYNSRGGPPHRRVLSQDIEHLTLKPPCRTRKPSIASSRNHRNIPTVPSPRNRTTIRQPSSPPCSTRLSPCQQFQSSNLSCLAGQGLAGGI